MGWLPNKGVEESCPHSIHHGKEVLCEVTIVFVLQCYEPCFQFYLGTSRMTVAPRGVKRKLNLGKHDHVNYVWLNDFINHRWTEVIKEQADTHSEAGQSSEGATDVSHSPDVQPSPQCPAPPPTAWQSTEVPDDQTENDDNEKWVKINIIKHERC